MKRHLLSFSFCLISMIVTAHASSPAKMMSKVRYDRYTGQQQDWPRSTEPVMPAEFDHEMPFYKKLPGQPYEILGVMSDEGDMAIKHVARAARLVGATAVLVVDDQAFHDAGIKAKPHYLKHADVPDPKGPSSNRHLDHPDELKSEGQPATIRVTEVEGILIRWKAK